MYYEYWSCWIIIQHKNKTKNLVFISIVYYSKSGLPSLVAGVLLKVEAQLQREGGEGPDLLLHQAHIGKHKDTVLPVANQLLNAFSDYNLVRNRIFFYCKT